MNMHSAELRNILGKPYRGKPLDVASGQDLPSESMVSVDGESHYRLYRGEKESKFLPDGILSALVYDELDSGASLLGASIVAQHNCNRAVARLHTIGKIDVSPFVSATSNRSFAELFAAGDDEQVYELLIPSHRAFWPPDRSSDFEVLIPSMVYRHEITEPRRMDFLPALQPVQVLTQ